MIYRVAQAFGAELCAQVVFLGGASLTLLVTDPAADDARPTKDVDVIVEVASYLEYQMLAETLRQRGFAEDMTQGAPICRWTVEGVVVDVMPTQEDVFGFGNRWHEEAFLRASTVTLPESLFDAAGQPSLQASPPVVSEIRLITAPYFLATKLEAYAGRGKGDLIASHDMEDIFTLIDGRATLRDEIVGTASKKLTTYIAVAFQNIRQHRDFRDAVEGNLSDASEKRLALVLSRIEKIAALAE